MKKTLCILFGFISLSTFVYSQKTLSSYDGTYNIYRFMTRPSTNVSGFDMSNGKKVNYKIEIASKTKKITINAEGFETIYKITSNPKTVNLTTDDGVPYLRYTFRCVNQYKNRSFVNLFVYPNNYIIMIQQFETNDLIYYQFDK